MAETIQHCKRIIFQLKIKKQTQPNLICSNNNNSNYLHIFPFIMWQALRQTLYVRIISFILTRKLMKLLILLYPSSNRGNMESCKIKVPFQDALSSLSLGSFIKKVKNRRVGGILRLNVKKTVFKWKAGGL